MNSPNILGVGIDCVELARVRNMAHAHRFAEYFLSGAELEALQEHPHPARFIASRFAAKEAVIKAFPGSLAPHDFQIVKNGKKPFVRFLRSAHASYEAFVSITYTTKHVIGYALVFTS
jgi:phosphopantetheine--protein transferase-like protein